MHAKSHQRDLLSATSFAYSGIRNCWEQKTPASRQYHWTRTRRVHAARERSFANHSRSHGVNLPLRATPFTYHRKRRQILPRSTWPCSCTSIHLTLLYLLFFPCTSWTEGFMRISVDSKILVETDSGHASDPGNVTDDVCIHAYVCMYVCMYVWMNACICMYECMHVCMWCMYICMYLCTYVCMYVFMCVCMDVCAYVCMYVFMCVCMDVCVYIYTVKWNKSVLSRVKLHFSRVKLQRRWVNNCT